MANPFEDEEQAFLDPKLGGQLGGGASAGVVAATPPPQQGQFANSNQGFLDWATQKYGADPTRGSGFVDAKAGGGFENMLKEYGAATGNTATFQGGPSGDRVDFGQGTQDALTSGGQIWNAQGGGGGGSSSGGGGGGSSAAMPWQSTGTTLAPIAPGGGTSSGDVNVVQPFSPSTPGANVSAPGAFNPQQAGPDVTGPGTGSTFNMGPMSEINAASRQGILDLMKQSQGPASMSDPALAAQSQVYSSTRNRQANQQRSAMAERAAASGLNSGGQGSGSFNTGLNSIYSSAGRDIAGNDASLMGAETAARRQQLMQSLQMATSVGARDEANQIQGQLANMDQEFRYAGLGQSAQVANQQNKFNYAGLNQQGSQNQQDMELRAALANQGKDFNYAQINQQGKFNQQGQLLQQEQGNRGLGFDYAQLGQQGQLGNRGLDVQQQLGNRGFDLEGRSLDQGQSQWDDRYGLDKARLGADVNRDAMMAALLGR